MVEITEKDIPIQFESNTGYGEDAAMLQKSAEGIPAVNIGVPTRYGHSQSGVIDRMDYDNTVRLGRRDDSDPLRVGARIDSRVLTTDSVVCAEGAGRRVSPYRTIGRDRAVSARLLKARRIAMRAILQTRNFVLFLFVTCVATVCQTSLAASFQVEDMVGIRAVGSPRISPDGTCIIYTIREVDLDDNRYLSSLWMVRWDGGEPIRLVDKVRLNMPRWSPDSERVAFFSNRDGEMKIWIASVDDGRVWAPPIRGPGHGPISTHRYYSGLEWSPDGRKLAFAAQGLDDPADPFLWKDWYRTEGFGAVRRRVHI